MPTNPFSPHSSDENLPNGEQPNTPMLSAQDASWQPDGVNQQDYAGQAHGSHPCGLAPQTEVAQAQVAQGRPSYARPPEGQKISTAVIIWIVTAILVAIFAVVSIGFTVTSIFSDDHFKTFSSSSDANEAAGTSEASTDLAAAITRAEFYAYEGAYSRRLVIDLLTTDPSEPFTEEIAEKAVDSLDVNWSTNALKMGQLLYDSDPSTYNDQQLLDALTNEYGLAFTEEEALYAIEHIEK